MAVLAGQLRDRFFFSPQLFHHLVRLVMDDRPGLADHHVAVHVHKGKYFVSKLGRRTENIDTSICVSISYMQNPSLSFGLRISN